ncbi:PPE domain-containing protein [Rhodococcus sp. NPDC058521]|uniref:PPE domain-containing protein n=1 Tax=Rhodococcus sp. NPDC058521 TaxID=3346536 RepID=UPI0036503509
MTLGLTGVIWLPRGATVNSTTLNAGAGPVPLSVASAGWTALSTTFLDVNATLVRVMAELGAGWQGIASASAIAKIAPFALWTAECTELAADTAAKAGLEAGAYTTARLVMPSIPEIVAVKSAKATAYTTGGALNGSAAVAEAADRAMDIRAGLVMEGYEAASNILALQRTYRQPPRIVTKADGDSYESFDEISDFEKDPVKAATAAAMTLGQNPGVTTAASQAGSIASTTVSTATSAATNIGSAAISASTGGVNSSTPMMGGAPIFSSGMSGSASTSAASARVPAAGGVGAPGGSSGAGLPEGWGKADGGQGRPGGAPAAGVGEMRADASSSAGARGASGSGPMMGGRGMGAGGGANDDAERDTPEYLKNFEHFSDGRTVIPSVIGADPEQSGR